MDIKKKKEENDGSIHISKKSVPGIGKCIGFVLTSKSFESNLPRFVQLIEEAFLPKNWEVVIIYNDQLSSFPKERCEAFLEELEAFGYYVKKTCFGLIIEGKPKISFARRRVILLRLATPDDLPFTEDLEKPSFAISGLIEREGAVIVGFVTMIVIE